jgi:hypothetical protein
VAEAVAVWGWLTALMRAVEVGACGCLVARSGWLEAAERSFDTLFMPASGGEFEFGGCGTACMRVQGRGRGSGGMEEKETAGWNGVRG